MPRLSANGQFSGLTFRQSICRRRGLLRAMNYGTAWSRLTRQGKAAIRTAAQLAMRTSLTSRQHPRVAQTARNTPPLILLPNRLRCLAPKILDKPG